MFNRTPDLNLKEVRKRQLEYVMRIGSGVASYNLVSISWITNKVMGNIQNFILKDRGHIFETVISLYDYQWSLKEVSTYCGNVLLEWYTAKDGLCIVEFYTDGNGYAIYRQEK